jgi:tryptophan halogenase
MITAASPSKVGKIAIIGGGSAGWMTASYLKKALPAIEIVLIEATEIPVIGVGEATIFALNYFLRFLQLREADWMPACKASYKYAIRFDNWYQRGEQYWHPFEILPTYDSKQHLARHWHALNAVKASPRHRNRLYNDCFLGIDLIRRNRIFRQPGAPDHAPDVCDFEVNGGRHEQYLSYAFHFDAGLFGEYLKSAVSLPNGVRHVIDEVNGVDLGPDGSIASLSLKSGDEIQADLFIDCTGFRAQLIDKTMQEPFDSYADVLICDKAIAMQVPYEDRHSELRPYTTATALSSGWVWNTPLQHRMGTGYVYCSQFKDRDAAETEYRDHLGQERVKDQSCRHLDLRVGKHRRTWVKNCVAIGLSAGFVEPLESTGIHFIHHGVGMLADALEGCVYDDQRIADYNLSVTAQMEDTREFLTLHYALTNRQDSDFWKHAKFDVTPRGILPELLERTRKAFPVDDVGPLFTPSSWVCILNGMNHVPKSGSLALDARTARSQEALLHGLSRARKKFEGILWNHEDYLDQMSEGEIA